MNINNSSIDNIDSNKNSDDANTNINKEETYQLLLQQAAAIVADESDLVANMANICALLKDTFDWLWVGFYRVDSVSNQLVLAPFQGPLACTRIDYGKGICGEVWQTATTQVVADVHQHPNHIACSNLSQSEIVVPVFAADGSVSAVLDIDSSELATFDAVDANYLEQLVTIL